MSRDPIGDPGAELLRFAHVASSAALMSVSEMQLRARVASIFPSLLPSPSDIYSSALDYTKGGLHIYAFNLNNSVNRIDPHGECSLVIQVLVVGGVAVVFYGLYKYADKCCKMKEDMRNANGDMERCGEIMTDCLEDTLCEIAPDPFLGQTPEQGCCAKIVCKPLWKFIFSRSLQPVRDRLPRRKEIDCCADEKQILKDFDK